MAKGYADHLRVTRRKRERVARTRDGVVLDQLIFYNARERRYSTNVRLSDSFLIHINLTATQQGIILSCTSRKGICQRARACKAGPTPPRGTMPESGEGAAEAGTSVTSLGNAPRHRAIGPSKSQARARCGVSLCAASGASHPDTCFTAVARRTAAASPLQHVSVKGKSRNAATKKKAVAVQ